VAEGGSVSELLRREDELTQRRRNAEEIAKRSEDRRDAKKKRFFLCALRSLLFVALFPVILRLCVNSSSLFAEEPPEISADDLAFFESKVRPLLIERCYECHSQNAKTLQGGLLLDAASGLRAGGDNGSVVVAGKPDESRLIEAIRYKNVDLQMPPDGQLEPGEIAILVEWVARAAPYPMDSAESVRSKPRVIDIESGKQFWSLRPLQASPPPRIKRGDWCERQLDAFILARLESSGIEPTERAERQTLIRRLSFDLIGLPPTPEEIQAFVNDPAPDACERLVTRLLDSPHYGERWARHWLDLARYCDIPESWSETDASAWRYRDWVIKSINEDLPYDVFVKRQLSADQMASSAPEDIAALGFIGLSPSYWKELKLAPDVIKNIVAEEWEERIHTFSSTVLGLTVACARCHDHKFDPVTQQDYYALAGVFASSRQISRPLLPADRAEQVMQVREKVKHMEEEVQKLKDMADKDAAQAATLRQQATDLENEIKTLREKTPDYSAPIVYAVDDASLVVTNDGPNRTKLEYQVAAGQDVPLQARGNAAKPGELVPRRFLSVLSPDEPVRFTEGSGRRELAEAVFRDAGPLVARVMVNRVWRHHFGRGLVETTSNFGSQGDRPTHPELLEDLARRFIESGWSLKWLHREIVMSATYQQSSRASSASVQLDPENVLLGRMNRRRLEVEAWRDAMLSATATLDPSLGGPAVQLEPRTNVRRTIYGQVKRRELHDLLRLYDFPDPTTHSPQRLETTTPLQQLFMLNSDFMKWQAESLLARLDRECGSDSHARFTRAFLLLYGRMPTAREETILERALELQADAKDCGELWKEIAEVLLAKDEMMFVE
jgi:hypothetical protein